MKFEGIARLELYDKDGNLKVEKEQTNTITEVACLDLMNKFFRNFGINAHSGAAENGTNTTFTNIASVYNTAASPNNTMGNALPYEPTAIGIYLMNNTIPYTGKDKFEAPYVRYDKSGGTNELGNNVTFYWSSKLGTADPEANQTLVPQLKRGGYSTKSGVCEMTFEFLKTTYQGTINSIAVGREHSNGWNAAALPGVISFGLHNKKIHSEFFDGTPLFHGFALEHTLQGDILIRAYNGVANKAKGFNLQTYDQIDYTNTYLNRSPAAVATGAPMAGYMYAFSSNAATGASAPDYYTTSTCPMIINDVMWAVSYRNINTTNGTYNVNVNRSETWRTDDIYTSINLSFSYGSSYGTVGFNPVPYFTVGVNGDGVVGTPYAINVETAANGANVLPIAPVMLYRDEFNEQGDYVTTYLEIWISVMSGSFTVGGQTKVGALTYRAIIDTSKVTSTSGLITVEGSTKNTVIEEIGILPYRIGNVSDYSQVKTIGCYHDGKYYLPIHGWSTPQPNVVCSPATNYKSYGVVLSLEQEANAYKVNTIKYIPMSSGAEVARHTVPAIIALTVDSSRLVPVIAKNSDGTGTEVEFVNCKLNDTLFVKSSELISMLNLEDPIVKETDDVLRFTYTYRITS
jgi:hypothetical protein